MKTIANARWHPSVVSRQFAVFVPRKFVLGRVVLLRIESAKNTSSIQLYAEAVFCKPADSPRQTENRQLPEAATSMRTDENHISRGSPQLSTNFHVERPRTDVHKLPWRTLALQLREFKTAKSPPSHERRRSGGITSRQYTPVSALYEPPPPPHRAAVHAPTPFPWRHTSDWL